MILSAVICTRGRSRHLDAALRSLAEQQSHDAEIIVVDCGTDDAHRKVASSYRTLPRLRYIVEPSRTLSAARNLGAREAYGAIVAFLDDDAVAQDGWLEGHAAAHEAFGAAAAVGGRVIPASEEDRHGRDDERRLGVLSISDHRERTREMMPTDCLIGNMSYKRAAFLAAGGFRTAAEARGGSTISGLSVAEMELGKRLAAAGRATVYTPKAIVAYRAGSERLGNDGLRRRLAWDAVSDILAWSDNVASWRDDPRRRPRSPVRLWRLYRLLGKRRTPLDASERLELQQLVYDLLIDGAL